MTTDKADLRAYNEFLRGKVRLAEQYGFDVDPARINPALKPFNRLMVRWMVGGGRRACFASFGLHKTVTQLETLRLVQAEVGSRCLIVLPLDVRHEFQRDAKNLLGWMDAPEFIQRIENCDATGIYLTNYETVRDGKLDPKEFAGLSLDEASCLRNMGTKTFAEFVRLCGGGLRSQRGRSQFVPYRFVATATPSPNEYAELLSYAAFLGVSDVSQTRTRFFKRNSEKADDLRLHPHKQEEFWLWVASWALFVTKPSDLDPSFSDEGYELEALWPDSPQVAWHEVASDHTKARPTKTGQGRLVNDTSLGVSDASSEKRNSMAARLDKALEIRAQEPGEHLIIWHDLEDERRALEKLLPGIVTVYGTQKTDARSNAILGFSDGRIKELGAKPRMLGSGSNFQRHCRWAIYLGIGFKFNDFIQSIHRIYRFGQPRECRFDLIYTEAERRVRQTLERKWKQHNIMVKKMTDIVRKYGLSQAAMAQTLTRAMGVERVEICGERYRWINNDNVPDMRTWDDNSVALMLSSWPFSTQYEYSPNYADFGHSLDNEEFFQQMDFLTPECYRVLQPGRVYAVHVKDRIMPSGMTGLGFQEVYPFHCDVITHMRKHGFALLGMKTIVTDVVRENNQTYRLGYSEQCKDGTKMGFGLPEYLLLFRKPPTDRSNGYADCPVVKTKRDVVGWECPNCRALFKNLDGVHHYNREADNYPGAPHKCPKCSAAVTMREHIEALGYSLARWQIDAHGYGRSSGDRYLAPEEWAGLRWKEIYRLYKEISQSHVYDYEYHVKVGEALEVTGNLPKDFMLIPPQSWHPDVWTDVTRMRTMNAAQSAKGKEMHICPLQFDIVDRVIRDFSMPGEVVADPFAGLGTVPLRAVELGRIGWGVELSTPYFLDGAGYLKAAEMKIGMPTLFDLLVDEDEGEMEDGDVPELAEATA